MDECGAPIVSLCGGEPLIHPDIDELVVEILERNKHIYLCTNGLRLEAKLPDLPRSNRLFINTQQYQWAFALQRAQLLLQKCQLVE